MAMSSHALSGRVSHQVGRGLSLLQRQGRSVGAFSFDCNCKGSVPVELRSMLDSRSSVVGCFQKFQETRASCSKRAGNNSSAFLESLTSKCCPPKGVKTNSKEYRSKLGLKKQTVGRYDYSVRASAEAQTAAKEDVVAAVSSNELDDKWEIKMLYDGECPLCMREVNMLRKRDAGTGKIKFVDIASDGYDPNANANIDFEMAMGRIHGIERDGTIVTNVEAFRKFYEAVNLGWVYAITKNKAVLKVADAVYDVWAKYRMQVTGRPPIEQILEERKKRQEGPDGTKNGRCRLDIQ